MVFRHVRYFLNVADAGSFALAAKRLRLAQPALSRQIQALEEEVGARLFERSTRGVLLTAAGEALMVAARPIEETVRTMLQRTRLAHQGMWGRICIGLGRAALESVEVGKAIAAFRQAYPRVQLTLTDLASFSQWDLLRSGAIDVAIAAHSAAPDPAIQREVLLENSIDSAILPARHKQARADRVSVADLRDLPFAAIARSKAIGFEQVYDRLKQLAPLHEYESMDSIFNMVAAGRAWSVGPAYLARNPPPGTAIVPLRGVNIPLGVSLYWRAADDSALLENALAVLRTASPSGGAGRRAEKPARINPPTRAAQEEISEAAQSIEWPWLRSFLTAVDAGSFSAAAERLGLTQSAVSRQMQELESRVGCPLLQRDTHGVALTRAGEVFQEQARGVVAMSETALSRARQAVTGTTDRCVVGALPAEIVGAVVTRGIASVAVKFPSVAVELVEMGSPAQLDALDRGAIDVAILGAVSDSEVSRFESVQLTRDSFDTALVNTSHPLAARASLRAEDLRDEPFHYIPRSASPGSYDTIMLGLQRIGLQPRMGPSFTGTRAMWKTAAEEGGWLIALHSQRAAPPPGLVGVPIQGLDIPWGLRICWRRGETRVTVRNVAAALREAGGA